MIKSSRYTPSQQQSTSKHSSLSSSTPQSVNKIDKHPQRDLLLKVTINETPFEIDPDSGSDVDICDISHLQKIRNNNKKLALENADLLKNLQILEAQCNLLVKTKSGLAHSLEEMKGVADHEANERGLLMGKMRNLEHIVDGLKENLNDETVSKDNLAHSVHKAQGEADLWRKRYETDGLGKIEEMEMSKMKMAARLAENQNLIEQLQLKLNQVDKRKHKLQQV